MAEFDVAPPKRSGFAPPQQRVPHDRCNGDVLVPSPTGGVRRLPASRLSQAGQMGGLPQVGGGAYADASRRGEAHHRRLAQSSRGIGTRRSKQAKGLTSRCLEAIVVALRKDSEQHKLDVTGTRGTWFGRDAQRVQWCLEAP